MELDEYNIPAHAVHGGVVQWRPHASWWGTTGLKPRVLQIGTSKTQTDQSQNPVSELLTFIPRETENELLLKLIYWTVKMKKQNKNNWTEGGVHIF